MIEQTSTEYAGSSVDSVQVYGVMILIMRLKCNDMEQDDLESTFPYWSYIFNYPELKDTQSLEP